MSAAVGVRRYLAGVLATLLISLTIPATSAWAAEPTASAGPRPRVLLLGDSTMAAAVWYDGQGVTRAGDILRDRYDIDLDAESCRRIIHRSCTGFDRITGGRYVPPNVLDEMRARQGQHFDALVLMAGYDEYDLGPAVPAVMTEAAKLGITRVYWLTFRTTTSYYLPGRVSAAGLYERLNTQLREQAKAYPSLEILEWDEATRSHCNQGRNPGSTLPGTGAAVPIECWFWWDGIHMTPTGAEGLMDWIGDQMDARGLSRCVGGTGDPVGAAAPLAPTAAGGFEAVEPTRVLDTRSGRPLAPHTQRTIPLTVPEEASAAVLTATATESCGDGFVTVQPCSDGPPSTSTLNVTAGQTVANSAIVPVGPGGVCVYSSTTADVTIDLHGWFTASGSPFAATGPHRVIDTRGGEPLRAGVAREISLSAHVAGDATAAWVSATAVGASAPGSLAVHACAQPGLPQVHVNPLVNLESVVSGAALVPVTSSTLCATATVDTHLVLDVFGAFGPSGTQRFVAASPERVVDTRTGASARLAHGGAPVTWSSYGATEVVNATLVGPWGDGYLTVHPCGSTPLVANANASAFTIVPTLAVVAPSAGNACATASVPAHLVVDRVGWFTT